MTIRPAKNRTSLSELSRLVSGKSVGEVDVLGISHDSREIEPGDLYVALAGANTHGAEFIDQAITNGAVAVASDLHGITIAQKLGLPTIELNDPRIAMAHLAARIYGNPEKKLAITGVTGTNGKTTTTHMLRSIFLDAGHHVGVIGTLGTYIDEECIPGVRTTPESTDLYALLAVMVERGITHVFMEVSSHALALHRVVGLKFAVAIFTNLTQDHLDFHGSMEQYFATKAKLFTPEYSDSSVICIDDSWGQKLLSSIEIPAIAIGKSGDWVASEAVSNASGMTLQNVQLPNGESIALKVNMLGTYNATNATCALAASEILGNPIAASLKALEHIRAIPGRLEKVKISSAGTAIVDYAHTPDAVATVLTVIRDASPLKIITVIGCGGDRDTLKRPLMGKIAAQLSDVVIVTDDNPRSEKPSDIRKAVLSGTSEGTAQVIEIGDRRKAISQALRMAQTGDVIAVLGKGHETGQEIAGEVFPFDDRLVVAQESANV